MAREMIPHRQTLISIRWPQPKSPIQMDNSTVAGVTNKTIVPRRAKMMDMRFWWLRCHASQDQFHYYWDAGTKNWADYHTKHHPNTYHKAHQSSHAGYWSLVGTYTHHKLTPNHEPTGFPLLVFPFSRQKFLSSCNNLGQTPWEDGKSLSIYIICMSASWTLFSLHCECCCKGV